MTPAARIAAAIEILDSWERAFWEEACSAARPEAPRGGAAQAGGPPALDALLARWGRANRYAGARDRAAIADLVHDALRRRRSLAALVDPGEALNRSAGRARMLALHLAEGLAAEAIAALFSGTGYGPEALTEAERAIVARLSDAAAREAVWAACAPDARADWPEWLWPALAASTDRPEAEAAALARRGAFDLRVNRSRATPEEARRRLAEEGVEAAPGPLSPLALRIAEPRRLGRSPAYLDGLIEPQDAASQATALTAAGALAALGEDGGAPQGVVIDYCAGAGGKALAFAAERAPGGLLAGREILAHDVDPRRMAPLPERARRAGARIATAGARDLAGLAGRAALVFVDAPCSGSGAWAREAEAKWRLTPDRLDALRAMQRDALAGGARLVAPGGVLAYVTCSLLRAENEDAAQAFTAAAPDFAPLAIAPALRRAGLIGTDAAPGATALRFSPARDGAGGFFIALWRRKGGS